MKSYTLYFLILLLSGLLGGCTFAVSPHPKSVDPVGWHRHVGTGVSIALPDDYILLDVKQFVHEAETRRDTSPEVAAIYDALAESPVQPDLWAMNVQTGDMLVVVKNQKWLDDVGLFLDQEEDAFALMKALRMEKGLSFKGTRSISTGITHNQTVWHLYFTSELRQSDESIEIFEQSKETLETLSQW